jgi:hypothetical protein
VRGEFSPKARELIITRDEGSCVVCGRMVVDTLDGHPLAEYSIQHRRARGMGGSRDKATVSPANGVVMCGHATSPNGCHHTVESRPAWGEARGYRVDQGVNPSHVPVWCVDKGWVLLDDFGGWTSLDVPFGSVTPVAGRRWEAQA